MGTNTDMNHCTNSFKSNAHNEGKETLSASIIQENNTLEMLVNLDDISNAPDLNNDKEKITKGLPSIAESKWNGPNPSLSEIQNTKRTSTLKNEAVMILQTGAMELRGSQSSYGSHNNHGYGSVY